MLPFNKYGSWDMLPTIGYTEGTGPDTITRPGTNHVKAAWVQLTGTLQRSAAGVWVWPYVDNQSGNLNRSYLVDIGIGTGAAPSRILVDNILLCNSVSTTGFKVYPLHFPLPVASANRFWARQQMTGASGSPGNGANVLINPYKGSLYGGESLARVCTVGATTGTSQGTTIIPGSGADTPGAWVDFTTVHQNGSLLSGSRVPFDTKYIVWIFGAANDYSENNQSYLYELAIKATDGTYYTKTWAPIRLNTVPHTPIPCAFNQAVNIPRGSQLACRGRPQAAGSIDNVDTCIYCVG